MTESEALAWCKAHDAAVEFYSRPDHHVYVTGVYGEVGADGFYPRVRMDAATLVEAIEGCIAYVAAEAGGE